MQLCCSYGWINVVHECWIVAPPAQEADQSSVSPRLGGGEEEEEDSGEEGGQQTRTHNNLSWNLVAISQ